MPHDSMGVKLLAEFIGTFLLTITIGFNILSESGLWAGVSIACMYMVLTFAFGGVSGANFNPAVSVALGLNNDMTWPDVGAYIGCQMAGGLAAGFSYYAFFFKAIRLQPVEPFSIWQAMACELLYTFMLVFVVLNVATLRKGCQEWYGLAIGFVFVAGYYGAGAVSMGIFNPAVAFGIDWSNGFWNHVGCESKPGSICIAIGGLKGGMWVVYTLFELAGAGLAVLLFKFIRPKQGAESEEYRAPQMLAAEFIGTYMLVLTVGMNVLVDSKAAAFSIAASYICMIYSLGDVSGAHFNPAVTLALLMHRSLSPKHAGPFVAAQIAGGIAAGLTYTFVLDNHFPLGPGKGYSLCDACSVELFFTAVLVLTVLCVAVNDRTQSHTFFGLAIGSCVTVGGYAIGAVSGGSLNPAVSIGIATAASFKAGIGSLFEAVAYCVSECLGAALASCIVMATAGASSKDAGHPAAHHRRPYRHPHGFTHPHPEISSIGCKLLAEFTGTFMLTFTIGCSFLSETGAWAFVSIGSVLMVAVFAFGAISGGNFNPAVSIALGLNGNMNWKEVGMYTVVQCFGSLAAGFAYFAVYGNAFDLEPVKPFGWMAAGTVELFYTFMLCTVVLHCAALNKGCQEWFGLAIGFVMVAAGYAGGPVSMACFNPAVAFGIDISSGLQFVPCVSEGSCFAVKFGQVGDFAIYSFFELIGAVLAALLFKVIRPHGGSLYEEYSLVSKLVAEFTGTFILMFTVGLNVLGNSPACAFSIAASYMCMVYAFRDVSGGHFNPAVTIAAVVREALDPTAAGLYMGVQVAGGVAAAQVYSFVYMTSFPLGPQGDFSLVHALLAEIIFTFVLVFVMLSVAVEEETKSASFFGLAIGSCLTVGGVAIGSISGGSLNPAVSIGIASASWFTDGIFYWAFYSLFEILGGILAAVFAVASHGAARKQHSTNNGEYKEGYIETKDGHYQRMP